MKIIQKTIKMKHSLAMKLILKTKLNQEMNPVLEMIVDRETESDRETRQKVNFVLETI